MNRRRDEFPAPNARGGRDAPPSSSRTPSWRYLRTPATSGARNMAIDLALVETVRAGGPPTLRLYDWSPACLSLGRNQPAAGHFPADVLRAIGLDIVRRPTGGRAVLHDGELTYSVITSDRDLGTAKGAYRRINEVLLAALADLGVRAGVAEDTGKPAPIPSTRPCFADPAPGEVLAAGRKLVGSAQLRIGGVLLQHGSILLRPSELLPRVASAGIAGVDGDPAYLDHLLGRSLPIADLVTAIERAWEGSIAPLEEIPLRPAELGRTDELEEQFVGDGWTWRH